MMGVALQMNLLSRDAIMSLVMGVTTSFMQLYVISTEVLHEINTLWISYVVV
jgi:hypothetical protein